MQHFNYHIYINQFSLEISDLDLIVQSLQDINLSLREFDWINTVVTVLLSLITVFATIHAERRFRKKDEQLRINREITDQINAQLLKVRMNILMHYPPLYKLISDTKIFFSKNNYTPTQFSINTNLSNRYKDLSDSLQDAYEYYHINFYEIESMEIFITPDSKLDQLYQEFKNDFSNYCQKLYDLSTTSYLFTAVYSGTSKPSDDFEKLVLDFIEGLYSLLNKRKPYSESYNRFLEFTHKNRYIDV